MFYSVNRSVQRIYGARRPGQRRGCVREVADAWWWWKVRPPRWTAVRDPRARRPTTGCPKRSPKWRPTYWPNGRWATSCPNTPANWCAPAARSWCAPYCPPTGGPTRRCRWRSRWSRWARCRTARPSPYARATTRTSAPNCATAPHWWRTRWPSSTICGSWAEVVEVRASDNANMVHPRPYRPQSVSFC